MDDISLAHSRYNCMYHIAFILRYRRKAMFGAFRKEVGEILGREYKMEDVIIVKAATMLNHVHMYVSIPLKQGVPKAVGRIKGKSALMIFDPPRNIGSGITDTLGLEGIIARRGET